jgi:hypothetical protein
VLEDSFALSVYKEGKVDRVMSKGKGFPHFLAAELRKKVHLASYQFQNEFISLQDIPSPPDFNAMTQAKAKPKFLSERE